jgi:hypothetical protein
VGGASFFAFPLAFLPVSGSRKQAEEGHFVSPGTRAAALQIPCQKVYVIFPKKNTSTETSKEEGGGFFAPFFQLKEKGGARPAGGRSQPARAGLRSMTRVEVFRYRSLRTECYLLLIRFLCGDYTPVSLSCRSDDVDKIALRLCSFKTFFQGVSNRF